MKIRHKNIVLVLALLLLHLISCDDGRIYADYDIDDETTTIHVTANINGIDKWPKGYNIAIAAFGDDSEYAIVSKVISKPNNDLNHVDVRLSGITADATTVELCAIDALRRKVVSFYRVDFSHTGDTLHADAGNINADMYGAIQSQIFATTCTACHGGGETAAAGLYLTADRSRDALVNRTSRKEPALQLVTPGESHNSVLYKTLATDLSSSWRINHAQMVFEDIKLNLVADWIDNGCK